MMLSPTDGIVSKSRFPKTLMDVALTFKELGEIVSFFEN